MKKISTFTLAPLGAAKTLTRGPVGPYAENGTQPLDIVSA
jgi:hypothetical protein